MLEDAGLFGRFLDLEPAPAAATPPPPRPHHQGHRARLRQRAALSFAALPDYELLELLLARSLPRGDIKPLAKTLLARFGGLAGVLGAGQEELKAVAGIGAAAALDLKLVHEATVRMGRGEVARRPVISSWSALLGYAKVAMAQAAREQFRVLFLDKKNQLIADEVMNEGTVDHAPVYPREVMRRALELSASAVILAHNHPSGDPTAYVPFLSATFLSLRREREHPERPQPVTVGDHVRERRVELGLTQVQAAARIGVCRDALARWESRPMVPDVHIMPTIISFLGGCNPLPPARTFPELLLRTRRTLGLDQAALASLLDVPFNTLHSWERGLFAPGPARRSLVEARIATLHSRRDPSLS